MYKFGYILTGSIGSGKSSCARILESFGYKIIDADKISHQILNDCSDQIVKIFGSHLLENNSISRVKLGALVFKNREKLKILENILHPKIKAEILRLACLYEEFKKPYFVDIPLFFESGNYKEFSKVILVYAPKNLLIKRVINRNNLNKDEATNRVNLQMDIEKKAKLADFIIDNSKDLKNLKFEIEKLLKEIG